MIQTNMSVGVLEPPANAPSRAVAPRSIVPPPRRSLTGRVTGLIDAIVPTILALAAIGGVVTLGVKTNWKVPKFSALIGREQEVVKDWCEEHSVPDATCVECKKECMPRGTEYGWCKLHGVAECPLCHPDVAQLPYPPRVTEADRERAKRELKTVATATNNPKCKLHQRRIQFASAESVAKLGVEVVEVGRGAVSESITALGEIGFDQTRVARLSARVPGVLLRVEKREGDHVKAGDVLALVDAAEVGKAKAEFLQALSQLDLKIRTLAALQASPATVTGRDLAQAEAAVDELRIRLINAEQSLANLDLPISAAELKGLSAEDAARRVRFLGLPDELVKSLDATTASGNLIPLRAPFDGTIVGLDAVAGQAADANRVLFTVADTRRMWLTLDVRLEDARSLAIGQTVRFALDGGGEIDGKLAWLSTGVDEKTRTVKVRAEVDNEAGRLFSRAYGTGRVLLRQESNAIMIPSEAVHWEGDCNVVFVRDKNFDRSDSQKVFHVRKVQPGAKTGTKTEIIAGLLPGELVATMGSGIMRTELLKNNLGAG